MDKAREREVEEKLRYAANEDASQKAMPGSGGSLGMGYQEAQCFSPKLALLSEIDRRVDSLLAQASSLRSLRQRVEMERDYTSQLVTELLTVLR